MSTKFNVPEKESVRLAAWSCYVLAILHVVCGFAEVTASEETTRGFAQVSGTKFIDAEGREMLLHGVPVISKSKAEGYTPWHSEADFTRLLASDIYWEYGKYLEKSAYLDVLQRPIPLAVAGSLERYGYDPEIKRFDCEWTDNPSATAPAIVYIPAWMKPQDALIVVRGEGPAHRLVPVSPDSDNIYNEIPGGVSRAKRQVTVQTLSGS